MVGSVTDDKFIEQMVAAAVEKFGHLDVLVNNAGIGRVSTLESPTLMEECSATRSRNRRNAANETAGNELSPKGVRSTRSSKGIESNHVPANCRFLARLVKTNIGNDGFGYDKDTTDVVMAMGKQLHLLNREVSANDVRKSGDAIGERRNARHDIGRLDGNRWRHALQRRHRITSERRQSANHDEQHFKAIMKTTSSKSLRPLEFFLNCK
ncbi:hypothetical protein U1Q18_052295 [Sarracenia purpurea var. burkii]